MHTYIQLDLDFYDFCIIMTHNFSVPLYVFVVRNEKSVFCRLLLPVILQKVTTRPLERLLFLL